jgi:hypothetical protein
MSSDIASSAAARPHRPCGGRPLGAATARLLDALQAAPAASAAELAALAGVDLAATSVRLSRLVSTGRAIVVGKVTRPPARRPLALYAPATPQRRCASIFDAAQ